MRFYSFIVIVLLSSCGSRSNNIDPAFQPLYDQFIAQANQAGLNLNSDQGITIQFVSSEGSSSLGEIIGECNYVGWGSGTITIDRSYWESVNSVPYAQQILLYHELGHCVLDEIHVTNPMAIMNAIINNPLIYADSDMDGMVQGLFKTAGNGGN